MIWRAAKTVLSYLNKEAQETEQEYEKVGSRMGTKFGSS